MSNPGVIYLAEAITKKGKCFRVEDNIGECIHLHYRNLRFDFTISEFIALVDHLDQSLTEILSVDGFDMRKMDPLFLESIASYLDDLEGVKVETIQLSDLKVQVKGRFGLPFIRGLNLSRVTKALNGDPFEQINYNQVNFNGQTNLDRLHHIKNSIIEKGYPFDGQYIVLFNDQNIIRDGQHRAGCLLYLKGDIKVPVMRMHFRNNRHSLSMHPFYGFLLRGNRTRLFKALSSIKRVLRRRIHFYMVRNNLK